MSLLLGIQIGKRAGAFSCPLTLSHTCFPQSLALGWRRRGWPRVGPPVFSAFMVVKVSHTLHPIPISFHPRLIRPGSGYVNTCLNYFKKSFSLWAKTGFQSFPLLYTQEYFSGCPKLSCPLFLCISNPLPGKQMPPLAGEQGGCPEGEYKRAHRRSADILLSLVLMTRHV